MSQQHHDDLNNSPTEVPLPTYEQVLGDWNHGDYNKFTAARAAGLTAGLTNCNETTREPSGVSSRNVTRTTRPAVPTSTPFLSKVLIYCRVYIYRQFDSRTIERLLAYTYSLL